MEELKFLRDMKMWSDIGTSPSKALCQTCPLHAGLSWFRREGTFPVPPSHLSGSDCSCNTRSRSPLSLVCSQSEADKLKISFFNSFMCGFLVLFPRVRLFHPRKRKDEHQPVLLLVSITVHTRIPVELLHIQVILPSTMPLAAGLSQSCGC